MENKPIRLIKRVPAFHDSEGNITMIEQPEDWLLWIAAIPLIGTMLIITYFLTRNKEYIIKEIDS